MKHHFYTLPLLPFVFSQQTAKSNQAEKERRQKRYPRKNNRICDAKQPQRTIYDDQQFPYVQQFRYKIISFSSLT